MSEEPIKKLRLITGFERVEEAGPRQFKVFTITIFRSMVQMTNFFYMLMGHLSFSMVERTFEATGRGSVRS